MGIFAGPRIFVSRFITGLTVATSKLRAGPPWTTVNDLVCTASGNRYPLKILNADF
jgi:hypothetical protein